MVQHSSTLLMHLVWVQWTAVLSGWIATNGIFAHTSPLPNPIRSHASVSILKCRWRTSNLHMVMAVLAEKVIGGWTLASRDSMYGSRFKRDLKELERPWYLRSILLRVVQPINMKATRLFYPGPFDHSRSFRFSYKTKVEDQEWMLGLCV